MGLLGSVCVSVFVRVCVCVSVLVSVCVCLCSSLKGPLDKGILCMFTVYTILYKINFSWKWEGQVTVYTILILAGSGRDRVGKMKQNNSNFIIDILKEI